MASAFSRRVYKLEGKLNCREPECRTCGAPHVASPRVVVTDSDEPLPHCPECDRMLNPESGLPLTASFTRITWASGASERGGTSAHAVG